MNPENLCHVVVDTNILIHCRVLEEIDWSAITESTGTCVVLTPTVIKEIDKLKADGNTRRASRAKRLNPLLAELETTPSYSALLSSNISVKLDPLLSVDWSRSELDGFDKTSTDDRLVAETWTLQEKGIRVLLVCNDTMARIKAARLGIAAAKPLDNWVLPAEPDERDREIRELRFFKKEVENRTPAPFVELRGAGADGVVRCRANRFLAPSDSWVTDRVDSYLRSHPRILNGTGKLRLPIDAGRYTAAQITEYNDAYDKFEQDVRDHYRTRLCEARNSLARLIPLRLFVGNRGSVPADRLLVRLSALGGAMLFSFEDGDIGLSPPRPPVRPRSIVEQVAFGGHEENLNRIAALSSNLIPPMNTLNIRREPEALVWEVEPSKYSPKKEVSLRCDLLRHGSNTREREIACQLPPGANEGEILATISCTNLPKETKSRLKFHVSFDDIELPEVGSLRT